MANFTFELGFDWNMPPSGSALEVLYALQMSLVDDDNSEVLSPCHSSKLNVDDSLSFRIYDFTGSPAAPTTAVPAAMQILFCWATDNHNIFSPIDISQGLQLPQLVTTEFVQIPAVGNMVSSISYGDVSRGWTATTTPASPLTLANAGRFELRAMVTVADPGVMARYYRVDPEMVIGDGGPSPQTSTLVG